MSLLVIDACLALGFVLPDEQEAAAMAVLAKLEADVPAVVPAHWVVEVTNGILMAERRGRLTQAQSAAALQLLTALPIETDIETGSRMTGDVMALARQFKLTAYDAAYLELAMRLGAELGTTDRDLVKAAKKVGVPIA